MGRRSHPLSWPGEPVPPRDTAHRHGFRAAGYAWRRVDARRTRRRHDHVVVRLTALRAHRPRIRSPRAVRGRRGGIESSSSLRGAVAMNNTLSEFGHTVGGSNTDGHGRKASRLGVEQASALPPLWLKVRVRRADDTLVQDVLTESHEMTRLKAMMAGLKVMPNKEVGWRPAGLPVRTHTHAHATSHAKLRPVEHIHPVPSGRRGKEAHDQMHPTDYG